MNTEKSRPETETKADSRYTISSRQLAEIMDAPRATKLSIWLAIFLMIALFVWASQSQIDKFTRGNGKVTPSLKVQYVQSFDGGIVSEIYVHAGDSIQKGDKIIRIDADDFRNKYLGSAANAYALMAQKRRLQAEANGKDFSPIPTDNPKLNEKLEAEKRLFRLRQDTLKKKAEILRGKVAQKELEFRATTMDINTTSQALILAKKMLGIAQDMLKHKVISTMQFYEKKQQVDKLKGEVRNKQALLPKIQAEQTNLEEEIRHTYLSFRSKAAETLAEVTAQLEKMDKVKKIDSARMRRAVITSPVDGVVKQMYYTTLGGVVKPGGLIAEIVPSEKNLIVETKIKPSDIAFIHTGQEAVVRFSAYDFAVFGSLTGTVVSISADTLLDKVNKGYYYLVKIKTERNYLEKNGKKLPIKIGMIATVDISNGKQSVLDYIFNPILKAEQNMLSNH